MGGCYYDPLKGKFGISIMCLMRKRGCVEVLTICGPSPVQISMYYSHSAYTMS